MERLVRGLRLAAAIVLLAYGLLVVKDFFGYIDRYPYLAVDDSLANISAALAETGRYGFMASPVQGFTEVSRNTGFFNYGPWYFWLGAGLIWLFGYSLTLMRAIHLMVILGAAVAGIWWFGRFRKLPVGLLFATALIYCFDVAHWPMVRPDAVVSAFAVVLFIAAGLAIAGGGPAAWLVAGFAAGSAATTHLIAWSFVPASVLVFFVDPHNRQLVPKMWRRFAGLAAGGLASAVVFYVAANFRFGDHWDTVTAYRDFFTPAASPASFVDVLATHVATAAAFLTAEGLGATGIVFGAVSLVTALVAIASTEARRQSLVVVAPPAIVLISYVASLGMYPNYHHGYVILIHVAVLWLFAAMLVTLGSTPAVAERRKAIELVVLLVTLFAGITATVGKLETESWKAKTASAWVSIEEYTDEVIGALPNAARAFGTITFGIENPSRVQLVQYVDGVRALERASLEKRSRLAPDYVVWGYPEQRDGMLLGLREGTSGLENLVRLFPDAGYRPVSMVRAAPYGVTRVLQRQLPGAEAMAPLLAAYDPRARQWQRSLQRTVTVPMSDIPPGTLTMGYSGSLTEHRAQRTRTGILSRGLYLVHVAIRTGPGRAARLIVPAATRELTVPFTELGPPFDFALYTSRDSEVALVVEHPGGAFFLSQFDSSEGADLGDVSAARVDGFDDYRLAESESTLQPLPDPNQWTPVTDAGVTAASDNGVLRVTGNASRGDYQLVSPPVPVLPGRPVMIRIDFAVESGRVCVGALTGNAERWMLPPVATGGEHVFVPDDVAMMVVLANCNTVDKAEPSRFTVKAAQYGTELVQPWYSDLLINARQR